ncbi:MAG: Asp-tRNA(Asn)/Glu-tRNA(Gln) amidotransferase subunit GatC [Tissierellaceae bacterium]|nr:Asp-tRNA(Asn)/Glu-tRNA(Gln) amidotransferase subunit GatC [Tissierellaceae bacterium]
MVTKEQIQQIASLCKLKYTEGEIDEFAKNFSQVLGYMEKLKEVDADNVEPLYFISDHVQRFREDVVGESLQREDVVKNTTEEQFGYFKILRIVE